MGYKPFSDTPIFVDLTGIEMNRVYWNILVIFLGFQLYCYKMTCQQTLNLWVLSDDGSHEVNGFFTCRSFEGDLWTAVSQKVATKNHPMRRNCSVPRARPFAAKVSSRVAASTPAMELELGFIGQTYLSAPGCFYSTSPLLLCSEMLNLYKKH